MKTNKTLKKIKNFWKDNFDEEFKDIYFRKLEIESYLDEIAPSHRVLDVGCGKGDVVFEVAKKAKKVVGLDFEKRRIDLANKILKKSKLNKNISFSVGDILSINSENNQFDRVITSRTLINLPRWNLQKKAIREILRVLKKGGRYLCFEVSQEGWNAYNKMRKRFGLKPVSCHWRNYLLKEGKFLAHMKRYFKIERIQRYGMYYFISRLIHPLMVHPDSPKFESNINKMAYEISKVYPHPFSMDSELGRESYYVYYVFRKP